MSTKLETDYLVIGCGAVGMAFVDTLLSETNDDIIIVDNHHKPGGHWNLAYSFVTLHQPSAFYGVSSKELSSGHKDQVGLNKGLNDLASGAQVSAYFDDVMRQCFLPSGRVRYFPMCRYVADGNFESRLTGEKFSVVAKKKTVDATYLKTTVPLTHTPNFVISPEVQFRPLNDLPQLSVTPQSYVIVGGGKTGIDACLWLLEHRVSPEKIQWIVPRDAWLLDRRNTQPTEEFFHDTIGAQAAQMESIAQADSIDDMFLRLEASGYFVRIDKTITPSIFHGATVSQQELAQLRRIKNIIRLGRVTRIETNRIVLEHGEIPTSPDVLHVDCSASAISNLAMKPIFSGSVITPQTVRSYQPVFSASFIAYVEANFSNDEEKNELCSVVPLPNTDKDYLLMTAAFMKNQYVWSQNKKIRTWLLSNRLDGFSRLVSEVAKDDVEKLEILGRLRTNMMPAMAKLQQFVAELSQKESA